MAGSASANKQDVVSIVKSKIKDMAEARLALVTGASSGIGLQYATRLAIQKKDLVLVSNQEKELQEVADRLSAEYGVKAVAVYKDLSKEEAAEELYNYCKENGLQVDILVNNAGVFFFNEYVKTDLKRIELMLNLHIKTVSKMCWYFGQDMKERGFGYILNMSSMSAWMTMPGINVYNASKAFILNFSRSLWYELMPHGVSVTAVCPGAVDTGLYGLSDYWRKIAVGLGVSMKPEELAEKALKKMYKKEKQYLPGWINHLFVPLIKHLPDFLIFFIIKKIKCFQK
jgi:short-subunit dehydrogenase